MKNCSSLQDLPTTTIPTKFVQHWQDEAMRLRDLAIVTLLCA